MRVAVLSDIHANVVALDAVLADAGSPDAVWHCGDVVGYGPEPNAVVDRLIDVGAVGVAGNHDRAAVGGREIEWFNADARLAMEWTRKQIGETAEAWLRSLPERRTESDVHLVHGSPRDPTWEYITTTAIAAANLELLPTVLGLFGHTHHPIAWEDSGGGARAVEPPGTDPVTLDPARRTLANPGSVGQPRDGDPRASWLELDLEARTARWHRVAYDIAAVQTAMRAAGLPMRLVERLRHGI